MVVVMTVPMIVSVTMSVAVSMVVTATASHAFTKVEVHIARMQNLNLD